MLHLTCGTSFLLLFVFLISLILHHHPVLLHCHALTLDRMLTFFMAFSSLVLELSFSQSCSLHSHHVGLFLSQIDLLELWPRFVRHSQAAVALVSAAGAHYNIVILAYLLTYLNFTAVGCW